MGRRRRFARKRGSRRRMKFTGRARRWRFVRNSRRAAPHPIHASYLDSMRDFIHARGARVAAGLFPLLSKYAFNSADLFMRRRMPWFQIAHRPHETDVPYMPRNWNMGGLGHNLRSTKPFPFAHLNPDELRKRRNAVVLRGKAKRYYSSLKFKKHDRLKEYQIPIDYDLPAPK